MKRLLRKRKRGAAIPLALLAVMILLAMGVGLMGLGLSTRVYSTRSASAIAARCAADAGLTQALFEMNEKLKVKPWNDSSLPLPSLLLQFTIALDAKSALCNNPGSLEIKDKSDGSDLSGRSDIVEDGQIEKNSCCAAKRSFAEEQGFARNCGYFSEASCEPRQPDPDPAGHTGKNRLLVARGGSRAGATDGDIGQ